MSLTPAQASPAASYLTRNNIVHPASEAKTTEGEAQVAAAEVKGRSDIATKLGGVTVSSGAIKRHR